VTTYFKRYKSYPTEQSVYMTVFYPAYRAASLDTAFSSTVQKSNPGIKTVGDYVTHVQNKSRLNNVIAKVKSPLSLISLAAMGLAGYLTLKG
jgi:hypothetical protein